MNEKVFISWHGEYRKVATLLGSMLEDYGYIPVVGGGTGDTNYVGEKIVRQMRECDMAIMLIDEIRLEGGNKFSENVMYEWGYLSAYLNDPKKIHVYLIDTKENSLPSDVLGSWVTNIIPGEYSNNEERLQSIADNILSHFIKETELIESSVNKMQYIADWQKNKACLYDDNTSKNISFLLLYGIQAAVYYDETQLIYDRLSSVKRSSDKTQNSIILLVKALLSVFIKTDRLTKPLSSENYTELVNLLNCKIEEDIENADLAAWCEILRKDKLELCHELAIKTGNNEKRYIKKALKQGKEVISLIEKQVQKNPDDQCFANLFLALSSRNMAELCASLSALSETEEEKNGLRKEETDFRFRSFNLRDKLRWDYRREFGEDFIFECLEQEYILSRLELYDFLSDEDDREDLIDDLRSQLNLWQKQNKRRNMIVNKIITEGQNLFGDESWAE